MRADCKVLRGEGPAYNVAGFQEPRRSEGVRKGKRRPLEELAPYLLELPTPGARLDWGAVFGNDQPVELEVGFGKGAFLVARAPQEPDVNFVGIEIDRGLQLHVANRLVKRGLRNVRLIRGDALAVLREFIFDSSLRAVHVYFPDPWWKRRHRKRRLFTSEFAGQCERVLMPGGRLFIATDVEEYYGVIKAALASGTTLRPGVEAPGPDVPETNFERKARLAGQGVWRGIFVRG